MPLFKFQLINSDTHLLVWKITETLQELLQQVTLKDVCTTRLNGMKSEQHQKGFLSVRMLLQAAGYTDFDMYYGEDGKPHLTDGKNISVSHSHNFSSIIISKRNVGIDLEMQRQKIISIAEKFAINEMEYLNPADEPAYTRALTVIWGVKEALFKMISREGMSFKTHMYVHPFELGTYIGKARVNFQEINNNYTFHCEELEGFTLVYTFEDEKSV